MDSVFINLQSLLHETGIQTLHSKKRPKFLLVGTHSQQTTGYSKVTYHIIQELAKLNEFDIYHFGFQKFYQQPDDYRRYPPSVDVYDPVINERNGTAPQESGFGYSQLPTYVSKIKPDFIMIYNDAGVICQFLDKLDTLPESDRTYKMIIYLDQVYIVQRPELLERIDKVADMYFVFTEYWKSVLESQGIRKKMYVMRHGFNPEQFKPLDRIAMRRKHNLPENLILFVNINRNTPRKRYDIVVQAFAQMVVHHPTKPLALLCVCDNGSLGGFSIQEIYVRELAKLNAPVQAHIHKLMIAKSSLNYTDEMVNEIYALSDVGITAADGEGFGLCQFEAMGIGIPQVVPYIGGFRDFCKKGLNCMAVDPKHTSYIPTAYSSVGGIIEVCEPIDIALAAEEYVMDSELREKHGKAARETVLEYKWEKEVNVLADVIRTCL